MKSDIIRIDNQGSGFQDALAETAKAAQYRELNHKEALQLQLCTEEMLSLVRNMTGELEATFWPESKGRNYELHLSTKTVMDREKRNHLLASASSRKNEAAGTFLGKLRDAFEAAMVSDVDYSIPDIAMDDMVNRRIEIPEWDEYEQSVLRKVANEVKIGIRGGTVDMSVFKSFD